MSVWRNAAFTFKESGNLTLTVSAGESNGAVSVQAGSQTWTIPAAGGELTQTIEVPQNVKVTVPKQYFNKILVNGADVTSSLTSTVSGNNKIFTISEFTTTTNIQVLFNEIPYTTNRLTFFFSGDNSVYSTIEYGSTTINVEPGTSQKTITGLTGVSQVNAYFKTINIPSVYHGSTDWSDRLTYLSSEGKYKLTINTSELTTDVFTVVFPIPEDAGSYITFADNAVKELCIAYWDINGDGELSESEAASVTSLLNNEGNPVFESTTITSFDEFKYFTGLTTIPTSAFYECKQLQSITLPPTIQKIEDFAFYGCTSMKEITLPEGLNIIGEWVFCKTDMETFYLPKNVSSIGRCILSWNERLISIVISPENQYFDSRNGCNAIIRKDNGVSPSLVAGCRYTIIPEDVVNISYGAFEGVTGLTSIVLPASVNYVADYAFANCTSLTSIVSKTTRPNYLTEGENNFTNISPNCILTVPAGKKQTYIDAGWTTKETDENGLFLKIVEEPDANDGIIEFADANVKTVCVANWDSNGDGELSKSEAAAVTSIGTVFKTNTTITSFDELQYFTSLTTLEMDAFSGCNQLTSIKFPSSLKTIKASAFQMCISLKNITLPEGLEFLSGSSFVWCYQMTRLIIPDSVTSITGSPIIYSPNISSIVVDDNNGAYDSRNGCNAIISKSTNELIAGCKNTIIPEDVVSIGASAFFGNSQLNSIVLPSSITTINNNAFNSCSSLKNVVCKMTTPPDIKTKSGVFKNINSNCVLTVPTGKKAAYIEAGWTEDIFQGGIVEAPSELNGDVNGDGFVTISDAVAIVNIILNQ